MRSMLSKAMFVLLLCLYWASWKLPTTMLCLGVELLVVVLARIGDMCLEFWRDLVTTGEATEK